MSKLFGQEIDFDEEHGASVYLTTLLGDLEPHFLFQERPEDFSDGLETCRPEREFTCVCWLIDGDKETFEVHAATLDECCDVAAKTLCDVIIIKAEELRATHTFAK